MKAFLRTVLCSTALASIVMIQGYGQQAHAGVDTASATQNQSTAPTTITPDRVPSVTQQKVSYAAEQLVQHVSRAQLYLHLGDKAMADQQIARALELVSMLKTMTPDQQARADVRSGVVSYIFNRKQNSYMVPLLEDTEVVKTYESGPFWSTKEGLAVKDVRAVNVAIKIDPVKAQERLEEARKELSNNNFEDASDALAKFQKSIVVEEKAVDMPLQQARENLNLAHFMMERNFYDGARYALNHADDALDKVKPVNEERRTRIKAMRTEIQQLSKAIEQKEPTIGEKTGAKIKKWWDELATWTEEKL